MIKGKFVDKSPRIKADITKNGKVALGKGKDFIIVDSGFNGDICAPPEVFDKLDLLYVATTKYQLADGSIVWKDMFAGEVILSKNSYEALFIEGDFLLGMDLASKLFSYFLIDFNTNKVELKIKS